VDIKQKVVLFVGAFKIKKIVVLTMLRMGLRFVNVEIICQKIKMNLKIILN